MKCDNFVTHLNQTLFPEVAGVTKNRGREAVTSDKKVVTQLVTDFVTRFLRPSPLFYNVLFDSLLFLLQGNKNFTKNIRGGGGGGSGSKRERSSENIQNRVHKYINIPNTRKKKPRRPWRSPGRSCLTGSWDYSKEILAIRSLPKRMERDLFPSASADSQKAARIDLICLFDGWRSRCREDCSSRRSSCRR